MVICKLKYYYAFYIQKLWASTEVRKELDELTS